MRRRRTEMSARSNIVTVLALLIALGASWLIWRDARLTPPDLRFAAGLLPLVIWGFLPVLLAWIGRRRDSSGGMVVRDQKRAVLALLKSRKLAGRRARYKVPFFLVIGPEGCGKSSILQQSGLDLGSGVRVGDSVWWIGDNAVFIESSTGEGHETIIRLAALLSALRPDLPLNSILLVLAPADLALTDSIEYQALAGATAEAVRELERRTKRRYPVYLMLSKTDLVPGFQEFFDHHEPQERQQIWGFGLPFNGLANPLTREAGAKAFTGGFRDILAAMRLRLVEWLSREGDPIRCGRILSFGTQIAAIRSTIQPMLDALLPESRREWEGAPLRGVFLTSARQEALTIDPVLPEMSQRFAMPRSGTVPPDLSMDEGNHGFFINGALRKGIFPELGLALKDSPDRMRVVWQWLAAAFIVAGSIALIAIGSNFYNQEIVWPKKVSDAVAALRPITGSSGVDRIPLILRDLKRITALEDDLRAGKEGPRYAFGLSVRSRLEQPLARARQTILHDALAPHLDAVLEGQLVDMNADVDTLKGLIKLADRSAPADDAAVHNWLEKSALAVPAELREAFVNDGLAAIKSSGGIVAEAPYIAAARRIIAYKESLS